MLQSSPIDLFYIDLQRNYGAICDAYVKDNDRSVFFVPNPTHAKSFIEEAAKRSIRLDDRLIHFQTVDHAHDDMLYTTAMDLARKFLWILRHKCVEHHRDRFALYDRESGLSLEVSLHDRFVSLMRGPNQLHHYLDEHEGVRVHFVPRPRCRSFAYQQLFEVRGQPCLHLTQHLSAGEDPVSDIPPSKDRRALPSFYFSPPTYDWSLVSEKADRGMILYFTNLRDKQYRNTSIPLIRRLKNDFPDYCLFTNYDSTPDQLDDQVASVLDPSRIFGKTVRPARQDAEIRQSREILEAAIQRFEAFCLGHPNRVVRSVAYILADYLGQVLPGLLHFVRDYTSHIREILPLASAVLVLPGRYLEPSIMVGLARSMHCPTFEVQSGTISPTRRFVNPRADDVLCIDPFSYDVYSRFLGHKPARTFIVGSPKIDSDLETPRTMSREQARARIAELDGHSDSEILLLATQPFGVAASTSVVRAAVEGALKRENALLLVKQHPNEDEKYARHYEAVAAELGFDRLIVTKTANVHHCIVAADVVMTYYSTVGLEAFALKRPVICINPFPGRPPFDLVAIGVATEVASGAELAAALETGASLSLAPAMTVLQDGLTVERCAAHLRNKIRYHRNLRMRASGQPPQRAP